MNNEPQQNAPVKVAVSGAAGFIGRRVVARLAGAGARVLALDRVPVPPPVFPTGAEYRCVEMAEALPALEGFDRIVHLAWNMDRADAEAQAASLAVFSKWLEQDGLRAVVGLGSAEEYGELEGCLSEEMAPGDHLSLYGRAKHAACRALEQWSRGPGRCAVWLRPFVVYGPGQGGSMVIPYALHCARDHRAAEFSEGLQFRDFVHVEDVAAGIAKAALEMRPESGRFTVCNLGRGVPVKLRDVLERIAENTGAHRRFHFGARPMRATEPKEQYADVAVAENHLGWRAAISWQEGIDALCKENEKGNHG